MKTILDLFNTCPPLDLSDLLKRTLAYYQSILGCSGGTAFVINGGTGKMEQKLPLDCNTHSFSLPLSNRIVARALQKEGIICVSGKELTKSDLPAGIPAETIRHLIAIPFFEFGQPTALLYLYAKTNDSQQMACITAIEKNTPQFSMLLHQVRIRQIQNDIRSTGDTPVHLRTYLKEYLNGFKRSFDGTLWTVPKHCYIQLVDWHGNNIRTVQGYGMPLSFGFMHSHPLDEKDIQAQIVTDPHFEIIAGFDPERFDRDIFEKYHHERTVRLWMPLFPVHLYGDKIGDMDSFIKSHIDWESEKTLYDGKMKTIKGNWSNKEKIPTKLIFGTLEIGYSRKPVEPLSLAPWNDENNYELANFCISRAYELVPEIFSLTLPGILEKMGKLLASATWPNHISLMNHFPQSKIREARNYPISTSSSLALPFDTSLYTEQPSSKFCTKSVEGDFLGVEYMDSPDIPPHISSSDSLSVYFDTLQNFNVRIANESFFSAYRLINTIIAPQELHILKDDPSYIGTLRQDRVVTSVCKEAAKATGATTCSCIFFEQNPTTNQGIEVEASNDLFEAGNVANIKQRYIGPPATWPKKHVIDSIWRKTIIDKARDVAENKYSDFLETKRPDSSYTNPILLLPVELSDETTGVFILEMPTDYIHSDKISLDLEERVPSWVYRISARRLNLRNQFIEHLANLRECISASRENIRFKIPENRELTTTFIKETLRQIVNLQKNNLMGMITIYTEPTSGPRRVERFFYRKPSDSEQNMSVDYYNFVGQQLSGPCLEACENHKVVIFSDRHKYDNIQSILEHMEKEAKTKTSDQNCHNRIEYYTNLLKGEIGSPSTVITIPLMRESEKKGTSITTYTAVLNHTHYYDLMQRRRCLELGEYFAETLDQISIINKQIIEKRFSKCLEKLRKNFVKAKNIDNLIDSLLKVLGSGDNQKRNIGDSESEQLNISDDIAVWNLLPGNTELTLRSAKGKTIDVLSLDYHRSVINPETHPYIAKEHKEKNITYPNKDLARLKSTTNCFLHTFSLATSEKNYRGNIIWEGYATGTGRNWLVTFPIIDATNRIYGIVDCLRDKPLGTQEADVLEHLLKRISFQLCTTMERCFHDMASDITKNLFLQVEQCLRLFHADDAYRALVQRMQEVFQCKHCDLLLEQYGRVVLHTTTRQDGPRSDKEKFEFWIEPNKENKEFLGTCLKSGQIQLQHRHNIPKAVDHISTRLYNLMEKNQSPERMAIPLKEKIDNNEIVIGLINLQEPTALFDMTSDNHVRILKRSRFYTAETRHIGLDLGLSAQRIIQMIRIVENQSWLTTQIAHSIGQPLQSLRNEVSRTLEALCHADTNNKIDIGPFRDNFELYFDFVTEAKDQLSFFAKIAQPMDQYDFKPADLSEIVLDCCRLMDGDARRKHCRIKTEDVRSTGPAPVSGPWLRKAILNLIDNACKYSWRNQDIEVHTEEEENGNIVITIKNFGIGIPIKNSERIFEPYFRFKVPDARGERIGTGSGLSIAKHAVCEIHGGEIDFQSEPILNKKGLKRENLDGIKNVLHETKFSIILNRRKLKQLSTKENKNGKPKSTS